MRQLKLSRPPYKRKVRTTNSQHSYPRYANLVQDLVVSRPDQVWVGDLTYVRLHYDFVYLAVLMEWMCIPGLSGAGIWAALRRRVNLKRPEKGFGKP